MLEWIGKPVIVLLNQTGRPRPRDEERADEARWRDALAPRADRARVLTLDAFARCWVQEFALFDLVGERAARKRAARLRPPRRRVAGAAPGAIRRSDGRRSPHRSRAPPAIANRCPETGAAGTLRGIGSSLGLGTDPMDERRSARVARDGRAARRRDLRAEHRPADRDSRARRPRGRRSARAACGGRARRMRRSSEGKAAVMGGVVSGALTRPRRRSRGRRPHVRRRHARRRGAGRAGRRRRRARHERRARQIGRDRCAGTTRSSRRPGRHRRCCAISPSRTTGAAAATGWRPSTRRSGLRSSRGSLRSTLIDSRACGRNANRSPMPESSQMA